MCRKTTMKRKLMGLRQERGAALVAVMLLTMVLSAVGVVAMQNTFNSLQLSGNYRLRKQAQETADAAMTFVSVRAGDRPLNYIGRMQTQGRLARGDAPTQANIEKGDYAIFDRNDFGGPTLGLATGSTESGFFNGSSASELSHESDPSVGRVDFQVVMRDPSEGPPPPGSDGAFCTKKVYIGSRSTYDALQVDATGKQLVKNWERPPRAASGMVALEAWIGPVPCNGGGSR